jgi:hypothetical protein
VHFVLSLSLMLVGLLEGIGQSLRYSQRKSCEYSILYWEGLHLWQLVALHGTLPEGPIVGRGLGKRGGIFTYTCRCYKPKRRGMSCLLHYSGLSAGPEVSRAYRTQRRGQGGGEVLILELGLLVNEYLSDEHIAMFDFVDRPWLLVGETKFLEILVGLVLPTVERICHHPWILTHSSSYT